jgi:hypothetical protein
MPTLVEPDIGSNPIQITTAISLVFKIQAGLCT